MEWTWVDRNIVLHSILAKDEEAATAFSNHNGDKSTIKGRITHDFIAHLREKVFHSRAECSGGNGSDDVLDSVTSGLTLRQNTPVSIPFILDHIAVERRRTTDPIGYTHPWPDLDNTWRRYPFRGLLQHLKNLKSEQIHSTSSEYSTARALEQLFGGLAPSSHHLDRSS